MATQTDDAHFATIAHDQAGNQVHTLAAALSYQELGLRDHHTDGCQHSA